MEVESPITNKSKTTVAAAFQAADIIRLYNEQLGIDVKRFFAGIDPIYLYLDKETGYRFYYPTSLAGDGKFYEALQEKLGSGYYHEWKFENQVAFDIIKESDKLLDIGCGTGNFLTRATEKTRDVYGLEMNEKAVEECRSRKLRVFNESIQQHSKDHREIYDMVTMFQVLEHVYDVKSFLEASLKVLKPSGKLVIGVPNSEPYFLKYDKYCTLNLPPHHMGLWNKKTVQKIAPFFNLKLESVTYDDNIKFLTESYTLAKLIGNVRSVPGKHSIKDKSIILMSALISIPVTFFKRIFKVSHGSHMVAVFQKI